MSKKVLLKVQLMCYVFYIFKKAHAFRLVVDDNCIHTHSKIA